MPLVGRAGGWRVYRVLVANGREQLGPVSTLASSWLISKES